MRCHRLALLILLALIAMPAPPVLAQEPLRIIAFGAHPDDCDIRSGGVAAKWAALGHKVRFVAVTNGDAGHHEQGGGQLAVRRRAEAIEAGRRIGVDYVVLDNHDGELVPSLDVRQQIIRQIREWKADLVLAPRPNDYHPDHRYTGVLMDDAAVVVVAPFFVPDTKPTPRNPVFMYYSDGFQDPKPFTPSVVVGIDAVADKKWQGIGAMPSQFGDKDSWQGRTLANVPQGDRERAAYLLDIVKKRNAAVADQYRDRLVALYGEERGRKIQYAEAFQLGQYGRQPPPDELKAMFPPQ